MDYCQVDAKVLKPILFFNKAEFYFKCLCNSLSNLNEKKTEIKEKIKKNNSKKNKANTHPFPEMKFKVAGNALSLKVYITRYSQLL